MSTLLKTLGYITGALTVSYLTLTTMMQDPHKSYRGHLNIRKDNDKNIIKMLPLNSQLYQKYNK